MKITGIFLTPLVVLLIASTNINAQSQDNDNENIKPLIEKKRAYNKHFGLGYRIQLYYGRETEAKKVREQFKVLYAEVYSLVSYDSPEWKTQVGNYKTKLDADRALLAFKDKFSSAIVVPIKK
jgi:hypothetical protein